MIKEFFEQQKQVHDYFGYVEDWKVIPLEDSTDCYWYLTPDSVWYCYNKENAVSLVDNDLDYDADEVDENDVYSNEIYTQRFLPKWVYEADDYTMICVDTQTDGNKFLSIFDNSKRVHDDGTVG